MATFLGVMASSILNPSLPTAEVIEVALTPGSLKHLVGHRGKQGTPGPEHPDTFLLGKRRSLTNQPESDLLAGGFQVQFIAGLQMQLVAQSFRDHDAAGGIKSKTGSHSINVDWVDPIVKPKFANRGQFLRGTPNTARGRDRLTSTWLGPYIRRPLWAFSTVVAPARIERGRLLAETTGGTSLSAVLDRVTRTRPKAAIVVTDGYIEPIARAQVPPTAGTRLLSRLPS